MIDSINYMYIINVDLSDVLRLGKFFWNAIQIEIVIWKKKSTF